MADFEELLSLQGATDWPWAEVVGRFALLLLLAVFFDAALRTAMRRLWWLGFDPRRRLAHGVPVVRALLVVTVFVGSLAPLHEARPGSAAVLALLGLGLTTVWALPHLRDMAAGLVLALTRPFTVGDAVDLAGVSGRVTSIGLTRVAVLAPGGETVWIPSRAIHARHLRVARGGGQALAITVDVPVTPTLAHATSTLRDLAILSPYLDIDAPVLVERIAPTTARVVATPTHFADEAALRSDLIERAARIGRRSGG